VVNFYKSNFRASIHLQTRYIEHGLAVQLVFKRFTTEKEI